MSETTTGTWTVMPTEDPTGIVRWEDPPPRGGARYMDAADTLKANPDRWALVEQQIGDAKPNVSAWRRNLAHLTIMGKFEVREVTVQGKTRVYARYTG